MFCSKSLYREGLHTNPITFYFDQSKPIMYKYVKQYNEISFLETRASPDNQKS